jgi:uncharacterized protein YndB with AHSA1/START domain
MEHTMPDIIQDLTINAAPARVFEMMAMPHGLDQWWTKSSSGTPILGTTYTLGFGPGYDWKARVTAADPGAKFELELTDAHPDWLGTRVGCELRGDGKRGTQMRFYHTGWPSANEHWSVSCYCWAMYLRIMRRYVEHGESVPYESRLDA